MRNKLIMKVGFDPLVKIYKNPELYTLVIQCPLEGSYETYETTDWDDALATAQDIAGEAPANPDQEQDDDRDDLEAEAEYRAFAALESRW